MKARRKNMVIVEMTAEEAKTFCQETSNAAAFLEGGMNDGIKSCENLAAAIEREMGWVTK